MGNKAMQEGLGFCAKTQCRCFTPTIVVRRLLSCPQDAMSLAKDASFELSMRPG